MLGLLYPTLERIKIDHGTVERCKTEMLAAWLQQQDNVTKKGVPSWSTLKTALENISEKELASEIGEYDTRENVEGRELRDRSRVKSTINSSHRLSSGSIPVSTITTDYMYLDCEFYIIHESITVHKLHNVVSTSVM